MNLKSIIGKAYLPSSLKLQGLLKMYFDLAFFLHREMEKNPDVQVSEVFKKACAEVGKASADIMREQLHLGDTFRDAVDSWIIGSKALNIKISVEDKGTEVIFTHLKCPMWEYFRRKGSILCADVCIPTAEAMAKEICTDVMVVVLRKPDMDHTCMKALSID